MGDKFQANSLDFFMNHLQVFCKQHVLWELKAMLTHQALPVRGGWMRSYLRHTCNLPCPLAWPPSALIYENDSSLKSFLALPVGCRSLCTGLLETEVINVSMQAIWRDLILNIDGGYWWVFEEHTYPDIFSCGFHGQILVGLKFYLCC